MGLHGEVSPAFAGLALSYALAMGGMLQYTTRLTAEVEARFTSVERISSYIRTVPSEAPAVIPATEPPKDWPSQGQIVFDKFSVCYFGGGRGGDGGVRVEDAGFAQRSRITVFFSLLQMTSQARYREGLPLVLRDVSFTIKPKERIGIAGRSGSGKSTLGMCIFRLIEAASGSICIDGVDIGKIGLDHLRKHLSVVPQV